ncbi:hypothetical protein BD779DRAFT_1002405 [Infundibulicybe gibba]|nr:hypothetical protein BD779DRAFT_1002405 [Infundibulicybe gibba]
MSPYSFFRRNTNAATPNVPITPFTIGMRRSNEAFFYPPLPPTAVLDITSSPAPTLPHPYQTSAGRAPSTTTHGSSNRTSAVPDISENGKEVLPGPFFYGADGTLQLQTRLRMPRPPTIHSLQLSGQRSRAKQYFYAMIFVTIIPFPTIFSVMSVVIGHAILRSLGPFSGVSIVSSAQIAAIGGIILTIPVFLLIYLLLSPTPSGPSPEDFFDDDDGEGTVKQWAGVWWRSSWIVLLGAAAGPLGATCLGGNGRVVLGTKQAAEAGLLGGAIIFMWSLWVSAAAFYFWWGWLSQRPRRGSHA